MSRTLQLVPDGWECRFDECPPGLFVCGEHVGLKTEYGDDAYCDSGEAWWGPTPQTKESRVAARVQPVVARWIEEPK